MNQEQLNSVETSANVIITAHAEFLDSALHELKHLERQLRSVEILTPGIALCSVPDPRSFPRIVAEARPIFVRHLAPVQRIVQLHNTEADLPALAVALAEMPTFALLERGQHFAVQTRLVQSEEGGQKHAYSGGRINQLLAAAVVEETGAVEDIKTPQIVVSLLCTQDRAYMGVSLARDNLSAWPGGMRHFAQTAEQISRAEFKLLEALEVFGVSLPEHGRALDLGAAPGGWTRLLLEAGLKVVAVDPAKLDPRLFRRPGLIHFRGYAERYLEIEEPGKRPQLFDVILNDMRMDARDAARLLIEMRGKLRSDGFILSTLKLPHATASIDPLKNLREAISLLSRYFDIVQARQLFHNRQEVTVIVARPRLQQM
ncbi:MAG TPA: SAM-dependent methyltransferase [Ktedonobacteraceae bacterium]|nr:SAM-dependent methyltransferase [Ktedonobacteraceae bacterium]